MDNIYIHVIDSFTVLFFIYIYLILFNKNHSYLFYQIIVYYKRISKSILFFQIKYEYQKKFFLHARHFLKNYIL